MNKHFYRIVFNKARGMLMVVAEIVKSHQGSSRSSQKAKSTTVDKKIVATLNPLTLMTYVALGLLSVSPLSYATTIVVDKSANKTQRPTVIETASGVTQVNIQTPTSGGVSHNKYTQFDVSQKGVILNNSYQASKTELGGYVKGNEFLIGSKGAKIILNEINSKNASQLNGYIEVAGQKSQVVIANAAGITCNGCGFINANRATLTTGKAILENGQLKGYQVEQGNIAINGKGLDGTKADYTDLIAQTVNINSSIWANDLSVVSGRNKVSDDFTNIVKLADTEEPKPQLAIDVAALGGMYANKIQLIGTETGVGVHNAGQLGASTGHITITADGKIVNSGTIQAKTDLKLTSRQDISNTKVLSAKNVALKSQQLHNAAEAEIVGDSLTFNHQNLTNEGLINGVDVNIASTQLDNKTTGRIYGTDIAIAAKTLNNIGTENDAPVIAARKSLKLGVGTLNNSTDALLLSLGELRIGQQIDNNHAVMGNADVINNHSARIESAGDMLINAEIINNINDKIEAEEVLIDSHNVLEYSPLGVAKRYSGSDYSIYGTSGKHNYSYLKTKDRHDTYQYYEYKYTSNTYETQVTKTHPAEMISGHDLKITANTVNNENSQIIAGNTLTVDATNINNISLKGEYRIENIGQTLYHDRYKHTCGFHSCYDPETKVSVYKDIIRTETDIGNGKLVDHTAIQPINDTIALPNNKLYIIDQTLDRNYLIETDTRFTNKKEWLSSDYMFKALKADPNNIQKRLGDGYYEQQLIKDQIIALTGQRYLGDDNDYLAQYQALMNKGVKFAKQYDLKIGIALTAQQMAALTTDIVWMVSKTVEVDGKTIEVLVPQVYIANHPQLTPSGALLAGKNVSILSAGEVNSSGAILSQGSVNILANNVTNNGLMQGNNLDIKALDSITSHGTLTADNGVSLAANNNVNLTSTTQTTTTHYGNNRSSNTVIDRVSSVQTQQGDLSIKAGGDVNLHAALLVNQSKDSKTVISAGHDANLSTLNTSKQENTIWGNENYRQLANQNVVGTQIVGQGDVSITAGNDLTIKSGSISSDKALNLAAGGDVAITSSAERETLTDHQKIESSGFLSSSTETTHIEVYNKTQQGSDLSGNTVTLQAGNDLLVSGSQVVSNEDTALSAKKNVNFDASQESYYSYQQTIKTQSGLMSGGGLGISLGKEKEDLKQTDTEHAYKASTIGSTEGSVNITSANDLNVKGSDIIAKKDVNLSVDNVRLGFNDAQTTYKEQYEYQKSGLTLAITGTSAQIYDAVQAVERAQHQDNDKLAALQAIKAGLTGTGGALDLQLKNKDGDRQASIGVSAMVGTQKTEREVNQEQHNVVGSSVSAGQNITITASGAGQKDAGDITLKGSEIKAGNDITLDANRDLNVIGAVNTQHSDRDEKIDGGAVGVQFQLGGDESGFRFKGSANFSRERENADGSAWTQSVMSAGNRLTSQSGHDTNMIGGQLKGGRVKTDVGNNLTIKSLQESDNYDYDKLSGSVSGSGGVGGFSANLALSKTDMASNWASVTEQSGIFAGKGGYDVKVGHNTDLQGAVIASKADDKSNNTLDTGSISFSNIENKADFDVNSMSINIGTSGGLTPTAGAPTVYHSSGSDHSTTVAAVEQGTLTVRNQDQQKQDVNQLSRDPENANNRLGKIFDRQKELDNIEAIELVKDMAAQAKDITNKYDHLQAQHDVDNNEALVKKQAQDAYAKLSDEDKAKNAFDDYYKQNKDAFYSQAVDEKIKENRKENIGGMGSGLSKGIDAATSIVTGLLTGDITGGLAGASAPYLAGLIKEKTKNPDGSVNTEANLIAHAVLGAAVAIAQGHSGLAGGAGAVTGEAAADIIREQLYGNKNVKDLSEVDKENISALAQLAAGLAVAAGSGGNTSDIGTAVSGSKNAVENNFLTSTGGGNMDIQIQPGVVDQAERTQEVVKDLQLKCGNSCTPEEYQKAFQEAGLENRFEQFTEEQRKTIYMLPWAGMVYGGFDAIKEGDITPLLQAGISQTEIGGLIMMMYLNQPNKPTKSEVLQKVTEAVQGKNKDTQIWTEGKPKYPVGNAYGHWDKHKGDFPEFSNSLEYVNGTHNFVNNPPAGTLTKIRNNGDTLYYNPATNTFAIKDKNGVPKTMYKPEKGLEYWNNQK